MGCHLSSVFTAAYIIAVDGDILPSTAIYHRNVNATLQRAVCLTRREIWSKSEHRNNGGLMGAIAITAHVAGQNCYYTHFICMKCTKCFK